MYIKGVKEIVLKMLQEKIYSNRFRELNKELAGKIYHEFEKVYDAAFLDFYKMEDSLFFFIANNKVKNKELDRVFADCGGNEYEPIFLNNSDSTLNEYVSFVYDENIKTVLFDESIEWEMRDGTLIEIKNMKSSHIQNTINMLKRNIEAENEAVQRGKGRIIINNMSSYRWVCLLEHELKRRSL